MGVSPPWHLCCGHFHRTCVSRPWLETTKPSERLNPISFHSIIGQYVRFCQFEGGTEMPDVGAKPRHQEALSVRFRDSPIGSLET